MKSLGPKWILSSLALLSFVGCGAGSQAGLQGKPPSQKDSFEILEHDFSDTRPEVVQNFFEEARFAQEAQGVSTLQIRSLEQSSSISALVNAELQDELYFNGDFHVLLALGEDSKEMERDDYNYIYGILGYLAKNNFRVLLNVRAEVSHLKAAVESDKTSVILWSSHGNEDSFYDYHGQKVPYDIFSNRGANFYQFILSACYGRLALDHHYNVPSDLKTWSWSGLTDPGDLKAFLYSDEWQVRDGRDLRASSTPPHSEKPLSCLEADNGYYLYQDILSRRIYGNVFSSRDACEERLRSSRESFVCSSGSEGIRLVSVDTATIIYGYEFDTFGDCLRRLRSAQNQGVCSRGKEGVRRVLAKDGRPTSVNYESLESCLESPGRSS